MRRSIGFFVVGAILALSSAAHAQTGGAFGIGPRVTFTTGDAQIPRSSALRLFGGQAKLRLTPSAEIEVSTDYESRFNEALSQRAKTMPIQASVLYFPVRSVVSPYVVGGVGWYQHTLTETGPAARTLATTSIREMGYHGGVGAEVRVGKRMALHGDVRYTHIRFGGAGASAGSAPPAEKQTTSTSVIASATTVIALIPKLSAAQESLKLSSQGAMWNWGLTVFF